MDLHATSIKRRISLAFPYHTKANLKRFLHNGSKVQCPICLSRTNKWVRNGYDLPVLYERKVVGGIPREDDKCPVCHSMDRVRLMKMYFDRHTDLHKMKGRLLHMAPELGLGELFSSMANIEYFPSDLDEYRYRHLGKVTQADVCALPFSDDYFDYVIINHVLEHIPDDSQAMRELFRVLKPGGTMIAQVPLALDGKPTDEDPTISDVDIREKRFGQWDHVRLYGPEYYERIEETGFVIELYDPFADAPEIAEAYHLNPLEYLNVFKKPAQGVTTKGTDWRAKFDELINRA